MHIALVMTFEPKYLTDIIMSYIVIEDQMGLVFVSRVKRASPWHHASIRPGLVLLLFIPSLF